MNNKKIIDEIWDEFNIVNCINTYNFKEIQKAFEETFKRGRQEQKNELDRIIDELKSFREHMRCYFSMATNREGWDEFERALKDARTLCKKSKKKN